MVTQFSAERYQTSSSVEEEKRLWFFFPSADGPFGSVSNCWRRPWRGTKQINTKRKCLRSTSITIFPFTRLTSKECKLIQPSTNFIDRNRHRSLLVVDRPSTRALKRWKWKTNQTLYRGFRLYGKLSEPIEINNFCIAPKKYTCSFSAGLCNFPLSTFHILVESTVLSNQLRLLTMKNYSEFEQLVFTGCRFFQLAIYVRIFSAF